MVFNLISVLSNCGLITLPQMSLFLLCGHVFQSYLLLSSLLCFLLLSQLGFLLYVHFPRCLHVFHSCRHGNHLRHHNLMRCTKWRYQGFHVSIKERPDIVNLVGETFLDFFDCFDNGLVACCFKSFHEFLFVYSGGTTSTGCTTFLTEVEDLVDYGSDFAWNHVFHCH